MGDLPFCFKGWLSLKCSNTHPQAFVVPKFSRGDNPDRYFQAIFPTRHFFNTIYSKPNI